MPPSSNFPHLPFPKKITGPAKITGNPAIKEQTQLNRQSANRPTHSRKLLDSSELVIREWQVRRADLGEETQQIFPAGVSLRLQVEDTPDLRFLSTTFGFEIVAEDEDGFVIVTTEDIDLSLFRSKVEGFATEAYGSGNAARLYELKSEPERINKLLSESLRDIWLTMNEEALYYADLGITCLGTFHIPDAPERKNDEAEDKFEERMEKWRKKQARAYRELAATRQERTNKLHELVEGEAYRGKVLSIIEDGFASLNDDEPEEPDYAASFTARIHITGRGLKDVILNYRFVLDAQLAESAQTFPVTDTQSDGVEQALTLLPPPSDAPAVCVIDSGIQQGHRLLTAEIDTAMS